MITLEIARLEEIEELHSLIPEFDPCDFAERIADKKHVLLLKALHDQEPAGYFVGYAKPEGEYYCWMVGVVPRYRRAGVWQHMLNHVEEQSRDKGFTRLSAGTYNSLPEMVTSLVKNRFFVVGVEAAKIPLENRIIFEKVL